ncbi:2-methylaconitate cis-trans isomerase PrpF [Pigmentiphaga soli]|uniref:2-methylaconitate cis-trans isomerase PrpF n=2 Tax=Pigmentiphaga soli TaxID=1007095 RepID=A0ABP8GGK4_9BURK
MRGGTSKALVFNVEDLPRDRAARDAIFLSAMGSPDPYGRQLDGMGGGVSSLSKVCLVGPPSVDGADVDYTFVQVQVKDAACDYRGNCGNMSSAIGPYAIDEGLVRPAVADGQATVRIHNTNTGKIIHSTFPVSGGRSVARGDLAIPGVAGTGAPVRLDFLKPGGATTGRLLPTGNAVDTLQVPGLGAVEASMVDAANACVFVDAATLGLTGTELPEKLEAMPELLAAMNEIRAHASVAMGIAPTIEQARAIRIVPFVGFVSAPQNAETLAGEPLPASAVDLVVRMLSSGQPHRALPLTASLCTAVAARIEGSVAQRAARAAGGALRLGMPSGVLTVDAAVRRLPDGGWHAERGAFFRTTRRLFDGHVYA